MIGESETAPCQSYLDGISQNIFVKLLGKEQSGAIQDLLPVLERVVQQGKLTAD